MGKLLINMSDMPNFSPTLLDKCAECKMPFSDGQDYWVLKWKGKEIINHCVNCWNNFSSEKKQWGKPYYDIKYNNHYEAVAEIPTDRGWRFTQTAGKGKGRNIWIDREKHQLEIVVGKKYIIGTNRDLDSDNIKNSKYIKLAKFSITENIFKSS